jgi:hypothetical protein
MKNDYKLWLASQGLAVTSISSRLSDLKKVETHYGPLDDVFRSGGFEALISELTYSKVDERGSRPNPSRLPLSEGINIYNNLASYKAAVALYARFLTETENDDFALPEQTLNGDSHDLGKPPQKQRLALESDMQRALRRNLAALEAGLVAIDDGAERAVPSGFIDILARDAQGRSVIIELKAGKTDSRVIGQILGYMGDITEEDPEKYVRGIIVADNFDQRTHSAARAVSNIDLARYSISFNFEMVG